MAYESLHPQTNLSVVQFYQQIGWKYKSFVANWYDRYKIDWNDTVVPKFLLPNLSIQRQRLVWFEGEAKHTRVYPIFDFAEDLLAQAINETITYNIETITDEGTWYIDKRPYFFAGQFISWIEEEGYKTYVVGWQKDFSPPINTSAYSDWLVDDVFDIVYPNILYIPNAWSAQYKRTEEHYNSAMELVDTNTWEFDKFGDTDEAGDPGAQRVLEEGHAYHMSYTQYHLDGSWIQDFTKVLDQWREWYIKAEFKDVLPYNYQMDGNIDDRRANILMDIEAVVSA